MSVSDESTASAKPTRCVLLKYPSGWAMLRGEGGGHPRPAVALDVGADAISVIDLTTNALSASASLTEVTAAPAKYAISSESSSNNPTAVMVVRVPGLKPLTIGSTTSGGWTSWGRPVRRFSWRGKVRRAKRPAYVVSDGVWLTLVETFGLAPHLEDRSTQR